MNTNIKLPESVDGMFHPSLFTSPVSKKKYIVPHWIEVPEETTMQDIQKLWIPSKSIFPIASPHLQEFKVPSTDGLRTYTVSFQNGSWSCTCPRYGFKRSCKHINSINLNKH